MTASSLAIVLAASMVRSGSVPPPMSHIRTGVARIVTAFHEGYRRSGTFRALVDRLALSGAVVYVNAGRCRPGAPLTLEGCTAALASTATVRYVKVVVDVGPGGDRLIALLGHELQHAVEIAEPLPKDGADARRDLSRLIEETSMARSRGAAILKELRRRR